ncbi:MAG: acyl carrier protein [Chitinispirillaceae bacterium]|jgi:acyl carrier protein|nr:acyl carrier protein [Chitinispirillaceae bacterium]
MHSRIREFIVSNFLFGEPGALTDSTPLLEAGIVDSTGLLEIIMFLETSFTISIEDHELLPDNLNSIENIVRFVHDKQNRKTCVV